MEEINSLIKQLAKLIGAEVIETSFQDNVIYINLKAFGLTEALNDVGFILRKIINKKTDQFFYIHLDINGYKKEKEDQLRKAVNVIADQVVLLQQDKTLNPMTSYERRIIHLELSKRKDIKTESIGEEKERKIIIRHL